MIMNDSEEWVGNFWFPDTEEFPKFCGVLKFDKKLRVKLKLQMITQEPNFKYFSMADCQNLPDSMNFNVTSESGAEIGTLFGIFVSEELIYNSNMSYRLGAQYFVAGAFYAAKSFKKFHVSFDSSFSLFFRSSNDQNKDLEKHNGACLYKSADDLSVWLSVSHSGKILGKNILSNREMLQLSEKVPALFDKIEFIEDSEYLQFVDGSRISLVFDFREIDMLEFLVILRRIRQLFEIIMGQPLEIENITTEYFDNKEEKLRKFQIFLSNRLSNFKQERREHYSFLPLTFAKLDGKNQGQETLQMIIDKWLYWHDTLSFKILIYIARALIDKKYHDDSSRYAMLSSYIEASYSLYCHNRSNKNVRGNFRQLFLDFGPEGFQKYMVQSYDLPNDLNLEESLMRIRNTIIHPRKKDKRQSNLIKKVAFDPVALHNIHVEIAGILLKKILYDLGVVDHAILEDYRRDFVKRSVKMTRISR